MRYLAIGLGVLLLNGCGAKSTEPGGPDVGVTAAPGVAFDYRYAFRLPAGRIAEAQEKHAQMCEQLGIARCRIVGLRYQLDGSDEINASLSLKLAPELARAFGKRGVAAIEATDGMLIDLAITGSDAGAAIGRADSRRLAATGQQEQVRRDLARPNLTAAERAELVRQRGALDDTKREAVASVADERESLASTPMTFTYETGRAIKGFGIGSRLAEAGETATTSFQWTLLILLWLLATLGPPVLLLSGLYLIWRRYAPKWLRFGRWRDGDPI